MSINRFNFRAYIKPYNKIYKVHSIEMSGNFLAIECFQEDGETLLKRNDNETNLFLFKQNEFELMQSTGLVDKNGKEVFEKDIIKFDGKYTKAKRLIRYSEQEGRLVACYTDFVYDYCDFNKDWILQWEVIGNIYENPELLKS